MQKQIQKISGMDVLTDGQLAHRDHKSSVIKTIHTALYRLTSSMQMQIQNMFGIGMHSLLQTAEYNFIVIDNTFRLELNVDL